MNLWVRSQNKEDLIPIKNPICVYDNKIIYKESASYIITIAEYKTKERTLEVLDEIQNKINLINLGHDFGSPMVDLKNPVYIYQMPEN